METGFVAGGSGRRADREDADDGDADDGDEVFVIISTVAAPGAANRLGAPAYSYSYLADRMGRALDLVGIGHRFVELPEYFGHPASFVDRDGASLAGRPIVHLCVRPFDQLRLIRGVYNIALVAWEYPVLKTQDLPGDMVLDVPIAMMSRFDEVWVTSDYARQVLEEHGLKTVVRMPSPFFPDDENTVDYDDAVRLIGGKSCVPFRHDFSMTHALNVEMSHRRSLPLALLLNSASVSKIVLTILNPGDPRKNLANMLTGFAYFAESHPEWIFLVKASQHGLDSASITNLAITPKLAGIGLYDLKNVYIVSDYLDGDELDALYSIADFYLSAPFAEGQNLPLQEAMVRGVVPIATVNTAMTEYVSSDVAITIDSHATTVLVPEMAHAAAGATVPAIDLAGERDILDALERAAGLNEVDYARLSHAAHAEAARHLSAGPIARHIAERVRANGRVPA